jgi:hypothetical protein
MKAEDLRIGNFIQRKSTSSICTVNWGIIKDFENFNDIKDYEPIPLTEQWLIDFKDNFDFFEIREKSYRGKYIFINIQDIILYFFTDTNTIYRPNGIEYEYVHSLQNLYYSLTGKELTKT